MKKSAVACLALIVSASAVQGQRLYIKPQLNFQFPTSKTIRQDNLPYAKIENNHRNAVVMPSVRLEYLKANGNGYFLNVGTVPVGFATRYTDYALIDEFYRQRAINKTGMHNISWSTTQDALAIDLGFINRLATVDFLRKGALDLKMVYGVTIARNGLSMLSIFETAGTNSMNKSFELKSINFPRSNTKSEVGLMVPLKLAFNFKNKVTNVERINLEVAYWHSFLSGQQNKFTYHNISDNVKYENVIESKGRAWQMSVQVPIRIKRIGNLRF